MNEDHKRGNHGSSSRGASAALWIGGGALGLTILAAPFLIVPAIHKIPWMVTPKWVINKALTKIGPPTNGGCFVDLGSGDGRLVVAAARAGYYATGFELNPVLVAMSYVSAYMAGSAVSSRASFRSQDFWKHSLKEADVVSCFGIAPVMDTLSEKMVREAKVGTKLVCFRFYPKIPPPGLRLMYSKEELYIYEVQGGQAGHEKM